MVALQAVFAQCGDVPVMQSADDVYCMMGGDQLVPQKLLGMLLCASVFEVVVVLLVSRRSLSLRVGVKNDADWRRHMWRDCHISITFVKA